MKFPEGKGSSPWSWWPQQWAPGNQTDGHNTRRHRGYVEWRPGASRAQAPQPATGTFLILCAAANNCWKLSSIWLFEVKKDPTNIFSPCILTWQEQILVDNLISIVYFHSLYIYKFQVDARRQRPGPHVMTAPLQNTTTRQHQPQPARPSSDGFNLSRIFRKYLPFLASISDFLQFVIPAVNDAS